MSKFFTPGTTPPGFYASRQGSDDIEITDEQWQELLAAQFAGKQIIAGADGMPSAVTVEAENEEE